MVRIPKLILFTFRFLHGTLGCLQCLYDCLTYHAGTRMCNFYFKQQRWYFQLYMVHGKLDLKRLEYTKVDASYIWVSAWYFWACPTSMMVVKGAFYEFLRSAEGIPNTLSSLKVST